MITLISATNNSDSHTNIISRIYFEELKKYTEDLLFFSLEELDGLTINNFMYDKKIDVIKQLQEKYITPASKFLFVIPEYNGSYPGILKLFIDALDVRLSLYGKKAGMVGVATGRAGNLRGIDHLTAVLHHMQVAVLPKYFPLSNVQLELDENNQLKNSKTVAQLQQHAKAFMEF
jgi:chromate reductase, NAD(P)H dehydrogenase (quinone)